MKKILSILLIVTASVALVACSCNTKAASAAGYSAEYAVEETMAGAYDLANVKAEEAAIEPGEEVSNPNRKLIKTVSVNIEVKDLAASVQAVKDRTEQMGGYVEYSDMNYPEEGAGYSASASFTIRIPEDMLDEFVSVVEADGRLAYKSENVQDVTLQYSDTESRKKSLLIERDRLNELMKQAEDVSDIVAVEAQLSQVRYELDSIESQLRTYDNQVNYSTVYVNLTQVSTTAQTVMIIRIVVVALVGIAAIVIIVGAIKKRKKAKDKEENKES